MTDNTPSDNNSNISMPELGGIGVGLMQWGTTKIDERVVNPKGNLSDSTVQELWRACRQENKVVFFDTAEGYGGGTSETRVQQVRQWYHDQVLDGQSDNSNVIVATKYLPTLWRWTKGAFYRSLRGSMQRLGVDKIDLYFIHTPIHPLPLEYHIQWACDAIDDGLIEHIGISNCPADLCLRAHKVAQTNGKRIAANQIMLNLLVWQSSKHRETVLVCQELGIKVVAYSPIGQGLLTDGLTLDKFQGIRAVKMTGVQYPDLKPLRSELFNLSNRYNATMAQVAINWVRGHGAVPLVGCRDISQTKDALDSDKFRLTDEEVQRLDSLSLGLSLFERPSWRRNLFVIFISILQMAYSAELKWTEFRKWLTHNDKLIGHEERISSGKKWHQA